MTRYQICKIEKTENGIRFLDWKNDLINYTNAMHKRYREFVDTLVYNIEDPKVWVLVACGDDGTDKYLQVGKSKNLTRMLSGDVGPDAKEILNIDGKYNETKYGRLTKKYNTLIFYEVDIVEYDLEEIFKGISVPAKNESLRKAFLDIKAACIEGKIAAENNCHKKSNRDDCFEMWSESPTGLDGYFYDYYKNKSDHSV